MKGFLFLGWAALSLTACSTPSRENRSAPSKSPPETVLVTYQVKPGKEPDLERGLSRSWEIYRSERLVFAQPHVIVRTRDKSGHVAFVEIFTWLSGDTPDDAPPSVKATWDELQLLCEPRDGKHGIEGGEVELVGPPSLVTRIRPRSKS